ncbi:MAG: AraC family ligand binding domain-containing protein [Lachnospiraceae bacterium]|nr:AraC family ligand binding domain-containing protein [Lachnospiraceae bacterium]
MEVGRHKYILHENDAFCIPRYAPHCYYAHSDDPWSILWVTLRRQTPAISRSKTAAHDRPVHLRNPPGPERKPDVVRNAGILKWGRPLNFLLPVRL